MRPFLSYSIDQLETEYDRARSANDSSALKFLAQELSFRKTPRAKDLREALLVDHPSQQNPSREQAPSFNGVHRRSKAGSTHRREHNPTAEQIEAIDCFKTGGSLKINAYAGTGKTSTLEMLAHDTHRRGQYIAFNKSIVTEASERFPETVDCATTHGLAFRTMMSKFEGQTSKLVGRINANQLAEALDLKKWKLDEHHTLLPRSQGYILLETIRRFAQSADREPCSSHVPRHGSLLAASQETLKAVQDFAVQSRMLDSKDEIPLGHDGYLVSTHSNASGNQKVQSNVESVAALYERPASPNMSLLEISTASARAKSATSATATSSRLARSPCSLIDNEPAWPATARSCTCSARADSAAKRCRTSS